MSDDVDIPDETQVAPDIGQVQPERPLFTIIKRGELFLVDKETLAGVRPCDHPRFILDDENLTVTCAACKERLNAYAVLRHNAAVLERIKRDRDNARHAHHQALAADVRRMLKRVCFSDEERDRMSRQTYLYGTDDALKAMKALHAEVTERVRVDHSLRRARTRHKAQQVPR